MAEYDNMEYRTVILAAFLHDIGKLINRGKFLEIDKGQHPKFSADFVSAHAGLFKQCCDQVLLKELVQKHHESQHFPAELNVTSIKDAHIRALARLVSKADNLSSSERGESAGEYQDYRTTPLYSVIERLNNPEDSDVRLKFHPLCLPSARQDALRSSIFAESFESYKPGELNKLITDWGKDFAAYVNSIPAQYSFGALIAHLDSLLYRYTWCIPSNTQELYSDVSLYDHLKVTAAIASCLYQYHEETDSLNEKAIATPTPDKYLLLAGDISGIQNYIFGITSSEAGGVAKRLRTRSLVVQMCSEIAAQRILNQLNLTGWNNIMSSGGNFLLLLPNLPNVKEQLQNIQAEIDRWFLHRMNGELALNLAWLPFTDNGFKPDKAGAGSGFSHVLYEVKNRLGNKKQQRFSDVLQAGNEWYTSRFIIDVDFIGQSICKACGKLPGAVLQEDRYICHDCDMQANIGAELPRARYIAVYADENSGYYPLLGWSFSPLISLSQMDTPHFIIKLNESDLQETSSLPASFKYLASYTPRNEQGATTFDKIASKSKGHPLLGFLKADVDDLGETFIFGFKRDKDSIDTISRQTNLSRLLDLFFTGYIEGMIRDSFPDCYTVFSGGDDLFYIGPWDQVLELATRLKSDFSKFTKGKLTISAGIYIAKHNYPISRAADDVNKALEKSKKGNGSGKKNRITIFADTLTWETWSKVRAAWLDIEAAQANNEGLSSSMLYNLLKFSDMWKQYNAGEISGLRYHPLLTYQILRNVDENKMPGMHKWLSRLLQWPPGPEEKILLDNLALIATLCLYSRYRG